MNVLGLILVLDLCCLLFLLPVIVPSPFLLLSVAVGLLYFKQSVIAAEDC